MSEKDRISAFVLETNFSSFYKEKELCMGFAQPVCVAKEIGLQNGFPFGEKNKCSELGLTPVLLPKDSCSPPWQNYAGKQGFGKNY